MLLNMKKIFFLFSALIVFTSCTNNSNTKEKIEKPDTRISLQADSILNTVKLTDTLVIFDGTCRGCTVENSTYYNISDSNNMVKFATIKTIDDNPPDMAGGSVSKEIEIVPIKAGKTVMKFYKYYQGEDNTKNDTVFVRNYLIEITN